MVAGITNMEEKERCRSREIILMNAAELTILDRIKIRVRLSGSGYIESVMVGRCSVLL